MRDAPKAAPDPASEQRKADATNHRRAVADALGRIVGSNLFEVPSGPDVRSADRERVTLAAMEMGAPYISAYAATKHAVVGFTRALGAEVAARGVTVNAVCPGYVDTEMTTESVARIVKKTGIAADQALDYMRRTSPQNRLFTADEVAWLIASLCDPRAGGVNAQAIVLDGGAVQS